MTIKKISFGLYIRDKRASRLRPYLLGWGRALNRYAQVHRCDEEAAYYYNERANLSILAAGAWLSGATALEEYSARKKDKVHRRLRSGRVDLYVADSKRSFELEAKQKWMSAATTDKNLALEIDRQIKSAVSDASCNSDCDASFGCVFFVPRFSKRRFTSYKSKQSGIIRDEIERYLKSKDVAAWAWSFPRSTRFRLSNDEKSYYPGVIIAIKGYRYWH